MINNKNNNAANLARLTARADTLIKQANDARNDARKILMILKADSRPPIISNQRASIGTRKAGRQSRLGLSRVPSRLGSLRSTAKSKGSTGIQAKTTRSDKTQSSSTSISRGFTNLISGNKHKNKSSAATIKTQNKTQNHGGAVIAEAFKNLKSNKVSTPSTPRTRPSTPRTAPSTPRTSFSMDLPEVPKHNPIRSATQQALSEFKKTSYSAGYASLDAKISSGKVAMVVKEAINTGFDAASLSSNDGKIGSRGLDKLNKTQLREVLSFAMQRINVRASSGELSPDAAKNAKAKINQAFANFSSDYEATNNMPKVFAQLNRDITDSNNASKAKAILKDTQTNLTKNALKGKNLTTTLGEVTIQARYAALKGGHDRGVTDMLVNFGQQGGGYTSQVESLLQETRLKETGGKSKAITHLSNTDLKALINKTKNNLTGNSTELSAALNQFALKCGLDLTKK